MADAFSVAMSALGLLLSGTHLMFLGLGVALGMVVGILPGLGGIAGLTLLLPFVFGMEPSLALALMIGMLAPMATSDTFPAVLMGIPGTSGSQATVVDGFPLAKRGEGARALGAAFTSSLFGGLFGAFCLTFAIFLARPFILNIGFGEQLMLVVFGLSMVGVLAGRSAIKGLAAAGIGLLIGTIGSAPATGSQRFTFDAIYLSDGIPLVVVGLGLFAFPEIIDLLRRGGTIADSNELGKRSGWLQGFKDVLANKWLVLRCSALGTFVGALPGLGGSVIDWIAYGHTVQSTKDKSGFGHGDIRGVIGPESANNAKEGGALIPTLLFGIPGSGAMAVLLGGFVLIGIEPGVPMVTRDLDLTFVMIWSVAIANVLAAVLCLFLAKPITKLTTIPYHIIGPIMLVIIFFAAFQATRDWGDFYALIGVGLLGVVMKRFGWSRPALLVGFVLSGRLEASIYQAIQVYGASFFERPLVLVIMAITVVVVGTTVVQSLRSETKPMPEALPTRGWQLLFTAALTAGVVAIAADVIDKPFLASVFPLAAAGVTFAMMIVVLYGQARGGASSKVLTDMDLSEPPNEGLWGYLAWVAGLVAVSAVIGFPLGLAVFVFLFTATKAKLNVIYAALAGALTLGCLSLLAHFLVLSYPGGFIHSFIDMPRWLGR